MNFFDILNGISPWWWVAFAFGLAVLEMATMSFFLIWPAMAAVLVAVVLAASPDLTAQWQLTAFAVLSILLTIIGRFILNKFGDGGDAQHATLNKRAAHFVGRTGTVLKFAKSEGVIEIEGMQWRARWPEGQDAEIGQTVRVVKAEGMTFEVETES